MLEPATEIRNMRINPFSRRIRKYCENYPIRTHCIGISTLACHNISVYFVIHVFIRVNLTEGWMYSCYIVAQLHKRTLNNFYSLIKEDFVTTSEEININLSITFYIENLSMFGTN